MGKRITMRWKMLRERRKKLLRLLAWAESTGIHVVAALAALLLLATTVIGSNDFGFKIEPDDRPVLYDLSLGILAAYFFNILIITIPQHRKQREVHEMVYTKLQEVVSASENMLRTLEFISRCPEKAYDDNGHLAHVLSNTPRNDTVLGTIRKEIDTINAALFPVLNHMEVLGSDMYLALSRLRDATSYDWLQEVVPATISTQQELEAARNFRASSWRLNGSRNWETLTIAFSDLGKFFDAVAVIQSGLDKRKHWLPAEPAVMSAANRFKAIITKNNTDSLRKRLDPNWPYEEYPPNDRT